MRRCAVEWKRLASLSSLVLGMLGSLYLSSDLFGRRQGFLRRLSVALVLALMGGLAMGIPLVYALLVRPDPAQDRLLLLALYAGAVGLAGVVNYRFGDRMSSPGELSTAGVISTLSWLIAQAAVYLAYSAACGYVLSWSVPPSTVVLLATAVLVAGAIVVGLSRLISDLSARAENRVLGGVGAFLTFLAFAVQFGLALTA
jgi:hypothetical protein